MSVTLHWKTYIPDFWL